VVIAGCLFIACGHAAKLLELTEAAFDEVALCVEMFVERIFERSRGIVGADGLGAFFGCSFSDVIGIVSCVGDDKFSRGCSEKSVGLRGVAFLARSEDETDRASQSAHSQVDLGAQAASRASDGLILSPPFAPLACW
jgi:hypothetical protein